MPTHRAEAFVGTGQAPPAYSYAEGPLVGSGAAGRGLSHAILIECRDESKAGELARQLAGKLLCATPGTEHPCGECLACEKMEKGIHPDFISYTGEGKSLAISVEKVRQIRAQAYILPGESERKVLLLRGVQTMLPPAQNALLKILEAPPNCTTFILTTTNRFALLETVRSRVRVICIEDEHTHEGSEYQQCAAQIIEHLSKGEEAQLLACLAGYEKDRQGFVQMLTTLRGCLNRHMVAGGYKGGGAPLSPRQLWTFADAAQETLTAAESNVGGLLLGCAFSAKLFEVGTMA